MHVVRVHSAHRDQCLNSVNVKWPVMVNERQRMDEQWHNERQRKKDITVFRVQERIAYGSIVVVVVCVPLAE